ncbi:MAG TPA: tail fiber domain-containing protein, partial [Chitinophagales bacterium]|nr:tail fiber domain-containing protein [Chitinophagales bacterium]
EGYNGSAWISLTATGSAYTAGTGINITGTTIANTAPTQWSTSGSTINYNTGKVGIGTASPAESFHVSGGNLLVTGTVGSSPAISVSGSGTRMFFDPNKAAFRAGNVGGSNWDHANIGNYSSALGRNVTASGENSIALGLGATASGQNSVAIGNSLNASGNNSFCTGFSAFSLGAYSIAMGYGADAEGDHSIAIGNSNTALGNNSVGIGNQNGVTNESAVAIGTSNVVLADNAVAIGYTNANNANRSVALGSNLSTHAYEEIVVGANNTDYTAISTTSWNSADRIFTVGNGAGATAKSNALTILKNGNTGIGTSTPGQKLEVAGTTKTTNFQMTNGAVNGYVLQSDANGNASWVSPGTSGITGLSPNYLPKWNGSGLEDASIFDQDGSVSIGTPTPDFGGNFNYSKFSIASGDDDVTDLNNILASDDSNSPWINWGKARGTLASLSSVEDGDDLFRLNLNAHDGAAFRETASIAVLVDGNPSFASIPSTIIFSTTAEGDEQSRARMRITSDGKVGIGEYDPQQLVDISRPNSDNFLRIQAGGTENFVSGIKLDEDDANYGWQINMHAENDKLYFTRNSNGNLSDHVIMTPQGYVGIGTDEPTRELDVSGTTKTINFQMTDDANDGYIMQCDQDGFATWVDPASLSTAIGWAIEGDHQYSSLSGNVGIGTSDPQQLLDLSREGADNFLRIQSGGQNEQFAGVMLDEFDSDYGWQMRMNAEDDQFYITHNSYGELTDYLAFTTDGNLGLGVTEPQQIVDIGREGSNNFLRIQAGGWDDHTSGIILDENGSNYGWQMKMDASNDKLYFTHNNEGDLSDQLILTPGGNTGIGTDEPSEKLEVAGKMKASGLQITDGASSGYLLQSDGDGNASWIDPASLVVGSDSWTVDGNDQYSTVSGNIGIGTVSPAAKLHVYKDGGSANLKVESNSSSANLNLVTGSSASEASIAAFTQGSQRWSWGKSNGSETGSDAGSDFFINRYSDGGTFLSQPFVIKRSSGNVGIGTSAPSAKLHITGGTDASFTSTSGYLVAGSVSSTNLVLDDNEIMARTNGAESALYLQNDGGDFNIHNAQGSGTQFTVLDNGNVGIGVSSPGSALDIQRAASGTSYVASISNTTNVNTSTDNGLLVKAGHNTFSAAQKSAMIGFQRPDATAIGSVQQSSGGVSFQTTSDERLKENIRETRFGLKDLMKIRISDYNYRDDQGTDQTGYLAQQLYDIFPNAVYKGGADAKTDPWMVDYGRITPLIVKSVQELADENEKLKSENGEQQQQLESLSSKLDEVLNKLQMMEASLSQCCTAYEQSSTENTGSKINDMPVLEQNVPNPFLHTSYIKFYIPSSAKDAMIVVSDLNGKVLKQFAQLPNGFGTVNIDAGTLAAGVYQYMLLIGGKVIDTKQMVLTR